MPAQEELLDGMPDKLPVKELLANMKGGLLVAMYQRLFRKYAITPRGVIHLGGHVGQEALPYLLLGYDRVVFVEPDPQLIPALERNVGYVEKLRGHLDRFMDGTDGRPFGQVVQAAIGDKNGTATLHVQPQQTQTNSILQPIVGSHEKLDRPSQSIEVPMQTLDTFMSSGLREGWTAEDFNVLYINVEGAELLVLRGAIDSLKRFELVYAEVNLRPHYEGNPSADDLESFMTEQGFVLRWAHMGFVPDTGYMIFTRPR